MSSGPTLSDTQAVDALSVRDVRQEMRPPAPPRDARSTSNALPTKWMFEHVQLQCVPHAVSYWIPNSHMLFLATNAMYRCLQGSRRAVHLIQQISCLEFQYIMSILWIHQILRAKSSIGFTTSADIDLLQWFDNNMPTTAWKIPGPLVPLLKVISSFSHLHEGVRYEVCPQLVPYVGFAANEYMTGTFGFYYPNFMGILRAIKHTHVGATIATITAWNNRDFSRASDDGIAATVDGAIRTDRFLTPGTAFTPHPISRTGYFDWKSIIEASGQSITEHDTSAQPGSWLALMRLDENLPYIRSIQSRFNNISECFDGSEFHSAISATNGASGAAIFLMENPAAPPGVHDIVEFSGTFTSAINISEPELSNAMFSCTNLQVSGNYAVDAGNPPAFPDPGAARVGPFWQIPPIYTTGSILNVRTSLNAWIGQQLNSRFTG